MDKRTILIADDEANIRLLVDNMLGKDYVVHKASDGAEAVAIARSRQPDLILMDIMMPKMDGYNACHEIKKDPVTKEIPVVMLTGLGHELNKKLAEQIGAADYLTKPFSLENLLNTIGQLLPAG
jgi:CheY-like chemotaxis protein